MPFQLQVSLWLPAWLTVPVEAVMGTASSKSENVPVLWASVPSGAVTALWSAATVGATSVKETAKLVVAVLPSALVAVMITVYGLSSSPVPDQLQVPPLFCVTVPL